MNQEHKRAGVVRVKRSNPRRFVLFRTRCVTRSKKKEDWYPPPPCLQFGIAQPLVYGIRRFLHENLHQWTANTNVWVRCVAYRMFSLVRSVSIVVWDRTKKKEDWVTAACSSPIRDCSAFAQGNWIILTWKCIRMKCGRHAVHYWNDSLGTSRRIASIRIVLNTTRARRKIKSCILILLLVQYWIAQPLLYGIG